jgi:cell division protein ZapA
MTESREAVRPLSVRILEKEYIVACEPHERTDLLDSAEILNTSMREIRDSGKIAGLDRIAVMAALNLAHEVLRLRARETHENGVGHDAGHRIRALRERVELALEKGQQLEL